MAVNLEKLSQTDVAGLLNLSTRQVRNLETEGLPVHSRAGKKWYVWREVLEWDRQRKEAQAREATKPDDKPDSLWEAERRKAVADADMSELKVEQLRRTLIAEEDAVAEITRFCERVRAVILSMRSRYQGELLNIKTIPEAGQTFVFHNHRFQVLRRQRNQITGVKVSPPLERET